MAFFHCIVVDVAEAALPSEGYFRKCEKSPSERNSDWRRGLLLFDCDLFKVCCWTERLRGLKGHKGKREECGERGKHDRKKNRPRGIKSARAISNKGGRVRTEMCDACLLNSRGLRSAGCVHIFIKHTVVSVVQTSVLKVLPPACFSCLEHTARRVV